MKFIFILFTAFLFTSELPDKSILDLKAPDSFKAKFNTTEGEFIIESKREWSPEGVDRLYQLISSDFYDSLAVFRVVDGFVAQFGIHNKTEITQFWEDNPINDEPTQISNAEGTMSFARAGDKTRSSQLFINLGNNFKLDDFKSDGLSVVGYPPIAKIIEGMDVIEDFYDGYGERLTNKQEEIKDQGNEFFKQKWKKIDYILSAEILK